MQMVLINLARVSDESFCIVVMFESALKAYSHGTCRAIKDKHMALSNTWVFIPRKIQQHIQAGGH